MKNKIFLSLILCLAFMVGSMASLGAAEYPNRPINLVVAYPAGGSTDIGARIIASLAEKKLGQPLVVLNKGGAGGQIGWTELANAKPDGYTIGFINLPAVNTVILDPERKATFGIDAFVPIINQVLDPGVPYVKPESPYKNLKDLVADAQKRPGQITVGTTGILSDDHLAILMLEEAAQVKFRHVHYTGGAPLFKGVLAGEVMVAFDNVGAWVPRVKGGKVRALAVLDKERSKFYPEVPTSVEQGFPSVISSSTRGIAGPKGIPAAFVKKLQLVFLESMKLPEHMEKMDKAGLAIKIMVGEEYGQYLHNLHERAKKLVKEARKSR